jgi:hypothetical protein
MTDPTTPTPDALDAAVEEARVALCIEQGHYRRAKARDEMAASWELTEKLRLYEVALEARAVARVSQRECVWREKVDEDHAQFICGCGGVLWMMALPVKSLNFCPACGGKVRVVVQESPSTEDEG